ncbi:hypothetical protein HNQ60_002214 [Povalibacter uvarum]|uniref:Uncharacterized protein n=1 Tax=Povalibacter uvarum TaxID=732238 RepID=A0A841HKH1_9GAMM|nr:hypothetical protein [Povalibacter uvarum]MBB6093336.1 hypothetical protein [Povalibacter uvarum]
MQTEAKCHDDLRVMQFVDQVEAAAEESARDAYRLAFERLRSQIPLHPDRGASAARVYESASATVRMLAERCLPLATAIAMHLYPLCALQCIPVPLLSIARVQRALLLNTIRSRSLILANAGSERARGIEKPLIASRDANGLRIDGICEYMSLSSVADVVLFKAHFADIDETALCAADLKADSVRVGEWKFNGTLRFSDTASVTFTHHRVPRGRYVILRNAAGLQCVADYQRCWFHLFLADMYLARLERLHGIHGLQPSQGFIVSRNEAARLREYSLHLLDRFDLHRDAASLMNTTSALKLRVSLMTQGIIDSLRGMLPEDRSNMIAADIAELSCIRFQPTADERILQGLCMRPVAPTLALST